MNARTWLNRARTIERELATLREAKQIINEQLTSATQTLTGDVVQSSKDPHKFDQIGELALTIKLRTMELDRVKAEILRGVNRVPDGLCRIVLIERYLNGKSMERVADDNNISRRNVWRIHGRAIIQMEDVLNGRQ